MEGGKETDIPGHSKLVTLFFLPFLYIGQKIFKNCFLLEANSSGCAKEFTVL